MNKNNDILVICTYKRISELTSCLNSVFLISDRPSQIIIIDGEDNPFVKEMCDTKFPEVKYYGTGTGLTYQRNFALDKINSCDLLFFVDDDTILGLNYFSAVRSTFKYTNAIGVGVTPHTEAKFEKDIYSILSGHVVRNQGKISRTGSNIGRFSGEGYCEWLPGCSMTYKFKYIGKERFDVKRKGYALGEDVDFSWRIGKIGKLYWTSTPNIFHSLSEKNRHNQEVISRMSIHNLFMFYKDGVGNLNIFNFVNGIFIKILFVALSYVKSRENVYFQSLKGYFKGLGDIILRKPLT